MDIRGKKIVVIGGAGLIGSHTVDLLTQEDVGEIVIYDNFVRGSRENLKKSLDDPRVRIFEPTGDLRQTDTLKRVLEGADGVLHFAALWLLECEEFQRSAFQVNVEGTFNVLEACVEQGVDRLVYSSSASVYGEALEVPMTESHPFNNTTFYGATKIAGEAMLRAYCHKFGLPAVGLRYMNVYGPRQDDKGAYMAVITRMLDSLSKGGAPTIHGDGSQGYDFIHVMDCARANICALKAETSDRFYNVGTGCMTTIRELGELILGLIDSTKALQFVPAEREFVQKRIGSTTLAANELGFRAEIDLETGLRDMIAWWENVKGPLRLSRKKRGARKAG
ncbi:MAG: NAD-dependent epimerase/dehydratase family protein [SAR324 cluster bacterium]|nr:NAD-dependent epimerase/dehydratase family protein [SAR324 cluster bacterium]